ncbi:XRE family transcriptional regulator [Hymenobacter sp. J193]|uniref:XRE family transcriptional regulator n=1 Tax=Hymenobacter sp. J193 TaxID=2898429 RepID=UPI0021513CCE|nr:XRE family transcriptional regulator [Hymenobacter sp. J193]MCR5886693.1 XRE family transcriptional regulator [Hymenobacter sp. J193]
MAMNENGEVPFYERVRARRRELGLTQEEFGQRIGISKAAVSAIEKGKNAPGPETYSRMVSEFNLGSIPSVGYIQEDVDVPFSNGLKLPAARGYKVPYLERIRRDEMIKKASQVFTNQIDLYNGLSTYPLGLPKFSKPYDGSFVVEIGSDDAMQPLLGSGSKVLAWPVAKEEWGYQAPGVYVVLTKDRMMVKRLKDNSLNEKKKLTLHPENTNSGSILTLSENELVAIWKVERIVDSPIS